MAALSTIAGRLPWWAKIAGKIVLSRVPVGGATWQRLGLFSPGHMLDPDYALEVFDQHFRAAGCPATGFSFAELGPGDSLASAVIGQARGASRSWLIDSGAYASRDMGFYCRLTKRLSEMHRESGIAALDVAPDLGALLKECRATYLENGLEGLSSVPDGSCDFIFSQAVLEHVPRDELVPTLTEIYRALKPGGISTHQIDFRDHLGNSLHNLRFSKRLWEAPWFARRSGFYTNRLRLSEIMALARAAGFDVEVGETERWPRLPLARARLDPAFRDLPEDDLVTWVAFLKLRKAPA